MPYVYVIADSERVKVGISRNPTRRLADLRREHKRPLALAYQQEVVNAGLVERVAHLSLARQWIEGEWFSTAPAEAIEAVKRAAEKDDGRETMHAGGTRRLDLVVDINTREAENQAVLDAFATADPKQIASTVGLIARMHGTSELAAKVGVSRQALYKALSSTGNPTAKTFLPVMRALGYRLKLLPLAG